MGPVIECKSRCTVTLVHEFTMPLLNLSLDDGGRIALSIIAVWVVGWSIRILIRMVSSGSHNAEKEGE